MLRGVDVSNNNGLIDWPAVAADGFVFAWAKITEGTTFLDRYATTNMAAGQRAGLAMGGYHFARPNKSTAIAQARFFCDHLLLGRLVPVLDYEHAAGDPLPPPTPGTAWVLAFLEEVERITGRRPAIYCNRSAWANSLHADQLGDELLWLATANGKPELRPGAVCCQYGTGIVVDRELDLNVTDEAGFARLTLGTPAPPAPAPAPTLERPDEMLLIVRPGATSLVIDGKHINVAAQQSVDQLVMQGVKRLDLSADTPTWESVVHNFGNPKA